MSLEEADFTPHGEFEGFKTLLEDLTESVVEIAREIELEVDHEDVTKCLQYYD